MFHHFLCSPPASRNSLCVVGCGCSSSGHARTSGIRRLSPTCWLLQCPLQWCAHAARSSLSRIGLSEKTASISQIALAASRKRDGKGNKSPAKMRIAATFSAGATFSGILVSVECDAEGPFRQKYLPIPVHRSARVECCVGTHSRGPRSQIIASNLLFRDDLRAQTSTCEVLASSSLCKLSKLCGAAKTDLRVYYPRVVAKNIDNFCLTEKNWAWIVVKKICTYNIRNNNSN